MPDALLTWNASPSPGVTSYSVQWTRNGANAGAGNVAQSAAGDASGYVRKFSDDNAGVALAAGDVVDANVDAVNDLTHLFSTNVTPSPITVPTPPPQPPDPPQNVTLTLLP